MARLATCVAVVLFSAGVAWADDVDGDGVDDAVDVCSNTPPDTAVDAEGRPLGDIDEDCDTDLDDFELFHQQGFPGLDDFAMFQLGFTGPLTSPGMVTIPGGSFSMGDSFAEGSSAELPVHTVTLSTFYMDKYEVTKELWDTVRTWGTANGYSDLIAGSGQAADHPVHSVNWYDCVKWCNARSEQEGRAPCYYTDAALTTAYKTGEVAPYVKWDGNGYRLPTEAEWEKAAGWDPGQQRHWRFGEGSDGCGYNCLNGQRANYWSSGDPFETGGYPWTTPVGYYDGSNHGGYQTQDAKSYYGCYDMSGNVWEWCNDWYASGYYSDPDATEPNPDGPAGGTARVLRGGDWADVPSVCRAADRDWSGPLSRNFGIGFRCASGTPLRFALLTCNPFPLLRGPKGRASLSGGQ